MRENDIHKLIEQEDPEAKQRIWEKICAKIEAFDMQPEYVTPTKTVKKNNLWKWVTATVAVIVVVTLSIVLPLALKDDGMRYCDFEQYTTEALNQTLCEYFSSYNENLLYVDWYGIAEETNTVYGYNKNDPKDIIYFTESVLNGETGEIVTLSITNNKTRVDIFDEYYESANKINGSINSILVHWITADGCSMATFEYQGHTYYLKLEGGDQARLTEIVEDMLK